MHIGTSLPEPEGPQALSLLRDNLMKAADDGFTSVWMANIFGLDALTALAVAGSGIGGIEIGTAVVPTYPRHAAVLAQQALTTALALDGRLALGIGLSHKIVIEDMYGYSFDAPATHMSEYLSILQPALDGEQVNVTGKTMRATIGLSTPRLGRVPVLLAAMGPQMLKLCGQRTDGTILWMTHLPSYRAMLDREGAAGPADVAIVGDEDTVADQITALADCGVTDFVAGEFAAGDERRRTRGLRKRLIAS